MRRRKIDKMILYPILFLNLIGFVMIFSASNILAYENYGDSYYFIKRHGLWMFCGFLSMFFFFTLDIDKLRKISFVLVCLMWIFLVLVFLPGFGRTVGGATRWIGVGAFTFQPAEFSKLVLIFHLANILSQKIRVVNESKIIFLHFILVVGTTVSLILFQPDLGTVLLILIVAGILLYLAEIKCYYVIAYTFCTFFLCSLMVFLVPWRFKRIIAFMDPFSDPLGMGYQLIQSLLAIARGGITGLGIGDSKQKLFYLPEPHTDFVFSVLGEELGLIGCFLVLILFFLLLLRGFKIAYKCESNFESLLVFGTTLLISIQGLLNMSVATGLVPTTGIPLPMISLGGSSLLVTHSSIGILMNISAKNAPNYDYEFFGKSKRVQRFRNSKKTRIENLRGQN